MSSSSSHPTRHKRPLRRRIVRFFRENMVEIAAGILLLGAGIIYLLYSPRLAKLPDSVQEFSRILAQPFQKARDWFVEMLTGPALIDFLTGSIVVFVIILVLLRLRHRFLYSKRWNERICPRCGEPIQRIHRKPVDRFLAPIILPHARRFHCTKCEWEGLRRGN